VHRVVEDAALYYKPVHYDHGSGLAAADVDGDGLIDLYFVNQVGGSQLYKNTGGGRFRNVTQEAGVALASRRRAAAGAKPDDDDDE